MRKILLGIILFLLVVIGVTMVTKGIGLLGFNIQSLGQIEESSKNLKAKIEESNKLIETDYPKKMSDLNTAYNNMQKNKKEYLEYVNKSSNEQIIAAKTLKSYAIEFLWTKLGTHAREEGVNLTFEIGSGGSSGGSTLDFTVDGSYIAITNFVYAIENDSDLDFRIQNFKLLPHEKEILEAKFSVSGVTVQGNNATSSSTPGSSSKTDSQKKTTETTSTNTANTNTVNSTNTVSETNTNTTTTTNTNTVSQ